MQPSSRFLFLPLSSSTTAMCLIAVSVLGLDDSFSKWQHLFCIKCTAWFLKVVSLFSFSDLQYNLTSDLLHKPSFPPRFYFHGNGSSNITNERVRARQGHLTCVAHVAYQRVIYSPTVYLGILTYDALIGLTAVMLKCSSFLLWTLFLSSNRKMWGTFLLRFSLWFLTVSGRQTAAEPLPHPSLR